MQINGGQGICQVATDNEESFQGSYQIINVKDQERRVPKKGRDLTHSAICIGSIQRRNVYQMIDPINKGIDNITEWT